MSEIRRLRSVASAIFFAKKIGTPRTRETGYTRTMPQTFNSRYASDTVTAATFPVESAAGLVVKDRQSASPSFCAPTSKRDFRDKAVFGPRPGDYLRLRIPLQSKQYLLEVAQLRRGSAAVSINFKRGDGL